MNWIIFLDRDWVINKKPKEHDYVKSRKEFFWNEWIKDFIKYCNDNDFLVIVITNQQWIWKWLYSQETLCKIHENINIDLSKIQATIDYFYFCPHLSTNNCECRKPKIWLLEMACSQIGFYEKERMLFIWDSSSDIESANNFWIRSIHIESNNIINYMWVIFEIIEMMKRL